MNKKKRLQMQRRHVLLPQLTAGVVYDHSGAPICQKCLSVMRPELHLSAFGIFADDDENVSKRTTWTCPACSSECVTA